MFQPSYVNLIHQLEPGPSTLSYYLTPFTVFPLQPCLSAEGERRFNSGPADTTPGMELFFFNKKNSNFKPNDTGEDAEDAGYGADPIGGRLKPISAPRNAV
jgi:hypothetical protein